jgi:ankyrin repeat protein
MRNEGVGEVESLIANGADVNARERYNRTALHFAALTGNLDVVELLIANGADILAKDVDNLTPLDNAISSKHDDVVAVLRRHLEKKKWQSFFSKLVNIDRK